MAISIRGNASDWIATAAATSLTPTLPTHATGDMLLVRVACKAATGQAPSAAAITCSTAGWNAVAAQFQNGTTVNGNGVGSVAFRVFYKIATSASETNPQIDFGLTPSPGMACAVVYQCSASETFITPVGAGGGDATLRTSQTCTIGSHISTTAGDMVDFYLAWGDNYASTSPTFTQTGVTFDTVAEQPATAGSFSDGFDGAADGGYRLATAGTSSAAAVVTATFGNSEQGGAWTTRLRTIALVSSTFGVSALVKSTISTTFTASALVKSTLSNSFSASAAINLIGTGSFGVSAIVKATISPTGLATSALVRSTLAGSFSASALVLRSYSTSFAASGLVLRDQQGSLETSALVLRMQEGTFTASSIVAAAFSGSFVADAIIFRTMEWTASADAYIAGGASTAPIWTTPLDGVGISAIPSLAFEMPDMGKSLHFHMQLDTVDTFNSGNLRDIKSNFDQTGWEYWDGDSWEAVPVGGVSNTFAGNEARYTVQSALSAGTWYRRVRAG